MSKLKLHQSVVIFCLILMTLACTSNQKERNIDSDTENVSGFTQELNLSEPIISIPPSDLLIPLDEANISLDKNAVNPLENLHFYQSTKSQAMALGIYLVDLTYLNYLDERYNIPNYLNCVKELSQSLNLQINISQEDLDILKNPKEYKTSLDLTLDNLFISINESLSNEYRNNMVSIIGISTIIETLYLITYNLKDQEDFLQLKNLLIDNKIIFDEYIISARQLINDPNVSKTLVEIEPLIDFFSGLKITSSEKKVVKNKDGTLNIVGGDTIELSWQDYQELKQIVNTIRNVLINK